MFAVYDVCKSSLEHYSELTKRAEKPTKASKTISRGIATMICDDADLGFTYWELSGTDTMGTVAANSVLAREMLKRL